MKTKIALGLVAAVVLTQAGCTTKIKSLPMPAAVQTQNGQDVALYFGNQTHAPVKQSFGNKEFAVRVLRKVENSPEANCSIALEKAVQELRDYARSTRTPSSTSGRASSITNRLLRPSSPAARA